MKKYVLMYAALLALTAAVWLAPVGTAQEQLPEQSSFLTACYTATQLGQLGGVDVSHCRKVSVVEEGNFALVTVKVKVAGQGWFLVSLALQKSVWTQSGISIAPA